LVKRLDRVFDLRGALAPDLRFIGLADDFFASIGDIHEVSGLIDG
jgi:hypothetical protein